MHGQVNLRKTVFEKSRCETQVREMKVNDKMLRQNLHLRKCFDVDVGF